MIYISSLYYLYFRFILYIFYISTHLFNKLFICSFYLFFLQDKDLCSLCALICRPHLAKS